MTMTLPKISPVDARRLAAAGARLIDIRGRDEFARTRAPGAESRPLDELTSLEGDAPVVFLCRSGMRTSGNAAKLASCFGGEAYILEGGLDAWKAAGLPLEEDRGQPLEPMRQVQIAAGSLVLAGVLLGFMATPVFFGLAAFVGAGLVMAGTTGWCGMARLLAHMPWNRPAG
jgi:rhodanese-related sulfurtransferase